MKAIPTPSRRRERTPAAAASTAVATPTEASRTSLSEVPNWAIAHSLTGVGVRSMTVEPTARTGETAGLTKAATR